MNKCHVCGSVHRTIGYRNCVINVREDGHGWHFRVFFPNGRRFGCEYPRTNMEDAVADAKACIDEVRDRK